MMEGKGRHGSNDAGHHHDDHCCCDCQRVGLDSDRSSEYCLTREMDDCRRRRHHPGHFSASLVAASSLDKPFGGGRFP